MSLVIPLLSSTDNELNSYCNFIEYSCFREGEIYFDEFDTVGDGALKLDDILKELQRRLDYYNTFVPYSIKKDHILSTLDNSDTKNLHYLYCLYYSIEGGSAPASITNIFEVITDNCLKNYFSTNFSHITSAGQSNKNLKSSIEKVRKMLKEDEGNLKNLSSQAKDGGIDIITYLPFDDRGNQVVCLTDATIGKNWKIQKKVKIKLGHWRDFIQFKVIPISCLSVVHIIEDIYFHSASRDNGLLFDRARIMKFFKMDSNIEKDLTTWLSGL